MSVAYTSPSQSLGPYSNAHLEHIVKFLGVNFDPYPKLSIEYVRGASLLGLLKDGMDFSRFESVEILRQCLDVIGYLHKMKPSIVHRDVSTGNILNLRPRL